MERRSVMLARAFMLSRLKGAAVNAKDQLRSLAIVAVGPNSLLMSTLLHCSEKDVDALDMA